MSYIGVGTVGLVFNASVGFDITSGTLTLEVRHPDKSLASWSVVVDSAPGGTCHHTTVAGDLPVAGTYSIRYKWVSSGGAIYYGSPTTFTVTAF